MPAVQTRLDSAPALGQLRLLRTVLLQGTEKRPLQQVRPQDARTAGYTPPSVPCVRAEVLARETALCAVWREVEPVGGADTGQSGLPNLL